MYDPTQWPTVGPFFAALNQVLERSGVIHGPVSIPLMGLMALLFLWILFRLIRRRRAGEAEPVEAAAPEAVEPEAEEEELPDEERGELSDEEIEAELQAELGAEAEPAEAVEVAEPEEIAPPPPPPPPVEEAPLEPKISFFARLRRGLSKTAGGLVGRVDTLVRGRRVDRDLLAELEEILFTADLGPTTAEKLLNVVQDRVREEKIEDAERIREILKGEIRRILKPHEAPLEVSGDRPFVIMVVGVNGVGKTTTIGKIASKLAKEGHSVIFGAADTFRAAADEQLTIWAERVGAEIIRQKSGADPSAVAYDAVQAAVNRQVDIVIVDTAGRLHTKHNLMEELKKVKRVMAKVHPSAPQEILLVLDANTGQNAIAQALSFHEALGLTGLILTKLDGTAKGGCIVGICDELAVPIRFIGIGEKLDDLRPFNADDFVEALFADEGD